MIVKDIVDNAKLTVLSALPVRNQEDTIMFCIYLGLIELYKRFNLSIKTEIIETIEETPVYELRNPDLTQVLDIYSSDGKRLMPASIVDDDSYDYKQLNYRSFLLTKPKNERLMFVYKAAPLMFVDIQDELDLPLDFLAPLLDYVGYRCHSTINKDNSNEAHNYYTKFEAGCVQLEKQGYKVDLATASLPIQSKGFI